MAAVERGSHDWLDKGSTDRFELMYTETSTPGKEPRDKDVG